MFDNVKPGNPTNKTSCFHPTLVSFNIFYKGFEDTLSKQLTLKATDARDIKTTKQRDSHCKLLWNTVFGFTISCLGRRIRKNIISTKPVSWSDTLDLNLHA